MNLDIETLKNDELEMVLYGMSSTNLFLSFKSLILFHIEKSLKQFHESYHNDNKNELHKELAQSTKEFLNKSEDIWKDIRNKINLCFKLPNDSIIPLIPRKLSNNEIEEIKKRQTELKQEYLKQKLFLAHLKQHVQIIEETEPLRRLLPNVLNQVKYLKGKEEFQKEKLTEYNDILEKLTEKSQLLESITPNNSDLNFLTELVNGS